MSTIEENTNPEEFEKSNEEEASMTEETTREVDDEQQKKEFVFVDKPPFWKRHFLKLLLSFLLIVSIAWGYFGKQSTISNYEKQISHLTETHEAQIKDLRAEHIKDLSSTLALAIRSELMAENLHQINQYFIQTVKMFDVTRILLVNHSTGEVIISTNKKDEGSIFEGENLVNASEAVRKAYNNQTYAATPIMGLNTQLAVLIIQID